MKNMLGELLPIYLVGDVILINMNIRKMLENPLKSQIRNTFLNDSGLVYILTDYLDKFLPSEF